MSHSYNTAVDIPFPWLPVNIYHLEGDAIIGELSAYIDTGANVTLVPPSLLEDASLDEI